LKELKLECKKEDIISRKKLLEERYDLGIKNMFNLYIPIADYWMFIDNSKTSFEILAEGQGEKEDVKNEIIWNNLKKKYYGN